MDLELEISRLRNELGAVQGQLNSLRKQVAAKEAEITQLKSTVDVLVDPNLGPFGPMGANALHMFEASS